MLNLIRAYTPFTVLIFFIAGAAIHFGALVVPVLPQPHAGGPLYELLIKILGGIFHRSAFAYTLAGIGVLLAVLLYLNSLLVRYRVFMRPGYAPAFGGLLFTGLLPPLAGFPVWIPVAAFSALGFGAVLGSNSTGGGRRQLFNAGFWMGLAALTSFPACLLLAALFIGLALLRPFKGGEWAVTLLGSLTPLYFTAGLLYLFNDLALLRAWPFFHFSLPQPGRLGHGEWIAMAGAIVCTLAGAGASVGLAGRSAISVRRIWLVITLSVSLALLVAMAGGAGRDGRAFLAMLPWLLPVVSVPFSLEKNKPFGTFIFYSLLLSVVLSKLL